MGEQTLGEEAVDSSLGVHNLEGEDLEGERTLVEEHSQAELRNQVAFVAWGHLEALQ